MSRGSGRRYPVICSLVVAGVVAASAGCSSYPAAGGAGPTAQQPAPPSTSPTGREEAGRSETNGSGTDRGAAIGLASPGQGTVAGAHLGRAEPVSPATIGALPAPAGRGATARGTVSTIVTHGPRDRKRIALTFDSNMTDSMLRRLADGKVTTYANPDVVDELQKLKVPATFFLAGKWVEAYPELTRRIAADPSFELASHSWAHEGFRAGCYDLGSIPSAEMAADVERSFEVLSQYSDHASRYFRFPGGCYDDAALKAIAPVGCTAVEYDDVSGDAFGTDPAAITAQTVRQAKPGGIVVLHITGVNARHTGAALPGIVRQLRAKGYELVTLGDLLT